MKKYLLILSALLLTAVGASAQIVSGTDYVIVNKEADQFLYGSYNWGCEASIGSKPVTFTVTESGDAYTLQANQWELGSGNAAHYVGNDFYTDKSSSDAGSISITAVSGEDGYYYLSNASGAYLVGNGKNKYTTVTAEADLSSDAAKWKFVTEAEILAGMENASSANPVDVSILISNPNFRPNGNGVTTVSNWTVTNNSSNAATVTVGSYQSNYVQANAAESYEKGDFSIGQTITLPKAGYYYLSAQGFYRDNNNVGVTAQMYAGDKTVDVPARRTTANTMADAWAAFLEGTEPIDPIQIVANDAEATVEICFSGNTGSSGTAGWAIFGEMTLMYYGATLTYTIGEPECSATTVKPGGTVTITFPNCITPDDSESPSLSTTAGSITVNNMAVTDASLSYSGTTATVTFTMPTSIGYGETVTVNVPAGLISWDATTTGSTAVQSPAGEFTLSTPPFEDRSGVYLYSVHAENFLSRGGEHTTVGDDTDFQSYGKIATTDPYGIPVDITFGDDGLATVKFLDSNLFLYGGGWAWTDGSEANAGKYLVKEVTTEDEETVYQFCYDGGDDSFLYVNDENYEWVANNGNLNGDNNLNSEIERTYWQIFTMEERDANKAAFVASQKAEIAEAVGAEDLDTYIASQPTTDITVMVADAALAGSISGWEETDYYSDNGTETKTYFTTNTNGTELYQGDAKLVQTVSGLSEGVYKVTLQGFVRQGSAANIMDSGLSEYDLSIAFLEANGYQINLQPWATECENSDDTYIPNGMGNAFTDGRTYANELYTYVDENGELEISINCPDVLSSGWMMVKNLTLTWYGEIVELDYANDVTWALANPSFEVDNVVANLTVDGTRGNENKDGGAWTVSSLTGWDLVAPTHQTSSYPVSDIMSAEAGETDNNFGVPGNPADGTYMLYLRNAHAEQNSNTHLDDASVMQTITLPAGDYKLTVDSKCVATDANAGTVTLVADEHSKALTIHTDSKVPEAWDTASLTFSLDTETEVTVGVNIEFTDGSTNYPLSVLLDNFKLYSVDAITKEISWTMTEAGWGTMILPFSATLDESLTAYSCNGTEESEDEEGNPITVVSLEEVGQSITANTPYIIKGTADTYEFTGTPTNTAETYTEGILTGTLVDLAVATGAAFATDGTQYLLQNHSGDVAFYPIIIATDETEDSSEATLDAYHCYLDLSLVTTSARPVALHFPGAGGETAIKAVESDVIADGAIYDLSGRRVAKAVKGVYIQNGKKVLVK